jgi:hypothetical protein
MNQEQLLNEEWMVHKLELAGTTAYYIGPVHGRTAYAEYKTKDAANAALEMRIWIAKYIKPRKKTAK